MLNSLIKVLIMSLNLSSKINPSDCVDMECDAHKNVLIKDTDGSLLGSPGSIIPDVSISFIDYYSLLLFEMIVIFHCEL